MVATPGSYQDFLVLWSAAGVAAVVVGVVVGVVAVVGVAAAAVSR